MKRASSLYIKRTALHPGQAKYDIFDTEPLGTHKRTPSNSSKSASSRGQEYEEVFEFGSFLEPNNIHTTPPKLERSHSSPFAEHVHPVPKVSTPSSHSERTRRRLRRRRATTEYYYKEERRWQPVTSGALQVTTSPDIGSSFESMQSSFSNFSGKTPSPVSCSKAKAMKFSATQQRNDLENLQLGNHSPTSRLTLVRRPKAKSPMKLLPSQPANIARSQRDKSFSLSSQDSLFGLFGDEEELCRGRSTSFAYGMEAQSASPPRRRPLYGFDQPALNKAKHVTKNGSGSPRSHDLLAELAELNTLSLKHISGQADATGNLSRGAKSGQVHARRRTITNIPLYRKTRVSRRRATEDVTGSPISPAKTCTAEVEEAVEVETEVTEEPFVYKFPLWEANVEDRDTEPSLCQPETEHEVASKQKNKMVNKKKAQAVPGTDVESKDIGEQKTAESRPEGMEPSAAEDQAKLARIEALRRKSEAISFMLNERLGGGTFGEVYSAINTNSGELFAVKQIKKSALVTEGGGGPSKERAESLLKKIRDEILLMSELDNPHIARYLGTQWNAETGLLDIFLEYFSNGSIAQMYQKIGGFKENLIKKFTRQIVDGVNYLHGKGIIHRDIKGANVLVTDQGNAKIADFGCSKQLYQAITPSVQASLCKIRGSIPWMAPEVVLQTGNAREAADVWSIGATVIEMATAKHPWPHLQNTVQAILHIAHTKDPPPIPGHLSASCKDFAKKCLQIKPEDRWVAQQLANHEYIEGQ